MASTDIINHVEHYQFAPSRLLKMTNLEKNYKIYQKLS